MYYKKKVEKFVPLAPHTTFQVGGPAEYYAVAKDKEELIGLAAYAVENNIATTVLGGGSNVLVSDDGVKGLVIKNEITGYKYQEEGEEVWLTVGSGLNWDKLVLNTVEKGYWGLENLSGIPGTVGGAVVQNINAYGVTVADMVFEVEALHIPSGKLQRFSNEECQFEYRNSYFKKEGESKDYIIISVTLKISKKPILNSTYHSASQSIGAKLEAEGIDNPQSEDVRRIVISIRKNIGMLEGMFNSAGSFFKNPIVSVEEFKKVKAVVRERHSDIAKKMNPWHWPLPNNQEKISAAFLMECTPFNKTGFKDKTYNGTVGISPLHSLSIINVNNGTADDVKSFVEKISTTIHEEFGIKLESEVCFL